MRYKHIQYKGQMPSMVELGGLGMPISPAGQATNLVRMQRVLRQLGVPAVRTGQEAVDFLAPAIGKTFAGGIRAVPGVNDLFVLFLEGGTPVIRRGSDALKVLRGLLGSGPKNLSRLFMQKGLSGP